MDKIKEFQKKMEEDSWYSREGVAETYFNSGKGRQLSREEMEEIAKQYDAPVAKPKPETNVVEEKSKRVYRSNSLKNDEIYKLYNIKTEEIYEGTLLNFKKTYESINTTYLKNLIKGKTEIYRYWCIFKLRHKVLHNISNRQGGNRLDKTIYKFQNVETGEIVESTQKEFRDKYNISPGLLCSLMKGRSKTAKGWKMDK